MCAVCRSTDPEDQKLVADLSRLLSGPTAKAQAMRGKGALNALRETVEQGRLAVPGTPDHELRDRLAATVMFMLTHKEAASLLVDVALALNPAPEPDETSPDPTPKFLVEQAKAIFPWEDPTPTTSTKQPGQYL